MGLDMSLEQQDDLGNLKTTFGSRRVTEVEKGHKGGVC